MDGNSQPPGTPPSKAGRKHAQSVLTTGFSPSKKKMMLNQQGYVASSGTEESGHESKQITCYPPHITRTNIDADAMDGLSRDLAAMSSPSKNRSHLGLPLARSQPGFDFNLGMTSPINQNLGVETDGDLVLDTLSPGFTPIKYEDGHADPLLDELEAYGHELDLNNLFNESYNVGGQQNMNGSYLLESFKSGSRVMSKTPVAFNCPNLGNETNVSQKEREVTKTVFVPESLESTYPTYRVMHEYCVVIGAGKGKEIGSKNPKEMTPGEKLQVHRMLQATCPVHGTNTQKRWDADMDAQGKKAKKTGFEYISTYYCKGRANTKRKGGCNVELRLLRVNGGLVMMEKCEKDVNDNIVTIKHNMEYHKMHIQKNGRKGKAGPLSIAQMEHIIKRCLVRSGERDVFISGMMNGSTIRLSNEQSRYLPEFKDSVFAFLKNNKKYTEGMTGKKQPMTLEMLLEIVTLLKDTSD